MTLRLVCLVAVETTVPMRFSVGGQNMARPRDTRTGAATVAAAAISYGVLFGHSDTHCFFITHPNQETPLHPPRSNALLPKHISKVVFFLPNAAIFTLTNIAL